MSENHTVSPLLDGFLLGQVISDRQGIRCIPAMREGTDLRYIVKIISIPASQTQLDALLLTGAYKDAEDANKYFHEQAQSLAAEVEQLSKLEGFLSYEGIQIEPMESGVGYEVYLLSPYRPALTRLMSQSPLTQLDAVNLGLDMCDALNACRQSGYLYADLKPGNIYSTDNKGYRIGDMGLISMTSLKYASLPEKYRSQYTAPEIADAFADINETIDVYALGLVLYQVYNDGQLPFSGNVPPEELLPPAYADYEMARIILKACDMDPANRWTDPAQLRQELVDYMQRNGVEATPIIPAPVDIVDETEPENEFLTEEENDAELAQLLALIPEEEAPEDFDEYEESSDEDVPEVDEILALADELIEHELPEPAVAPEPIDVPVPAPLYEPAPEPEIQEESVEPTLDLKIEPITIPPAPLEYNDEEEEYPQTPPRRKIPGRLIAFFAAIVLLIGLCVGIYLYYQNSYLQTIDTLSIQGEGDRVTVLIRTDADESLLSVSCSDSYGNTLRSDVVDGKASFSGLRPNYQYRIQIHISGRHKLTGSTYGTYTASYPEGYFITIHSLSAISTENQIIVTIETDADTSLLSMLCTDPEGKSLKSPIIGGKAAFTGLMPNTRYHISVQFQGNHALQGQSSIECQTKEQSETPDPV